MKYFLVIIVAVATLTERISTKSAGRIIGGTPAYAGQFPFAAAIYVTTPTGRYFCGGTLIANQWVLTAAQCCDGATSYTIQLGSNNLIESDPNRVRVTTTQCIIQPTFNSSTFMSDVALIKLRSPIQFTDYIKPVSLPNIDVPETISGTALGWGWTSDEATSYSEQLNHVTLAVVPYDDCIRTYGSDVISPSYTLCTEGSYNEGTCTGDSGGPFLVHLANGNVWQIGIASFLSGYGCELPHPSGYTKIYPYITWIKNETGI